VRRLLVVLRQLAMACVFVSSSACSSLGYYAHVAKGQATLLIHRRSIAALVADPATDTKLRIRLEETQAARAFASDHLGLPRNRSYTSYVDLQRPYVTWNVFAAPEFSVDALTHCFAFAGCVAYQGYFDRARAEHAAKVLGDLGNDTQVEGTVAYSTLGWFADPILSSMLRWSDDELDATIFHELAHQKLYVKDDTAFNESYASFVQEQGLREWRASRGLPPLDAAERVHDEAFTRSVLDLRERLRGVYAQSLSIDAKRAAKQREIGAFRDRYRHMRDTEWGGDARYDRWVGAPINNASLVPFGLYERWVDAFAQIFAQAHASWPEFFERVRVLAEHSRRERDETLTSLAAATPSADRDTNAERSSPRP